MVLLNSSGDGLPVVAFPRYRLDSSGVRRGSLPAAATRIWRARRAIREAGVIYVLHFALAFTAFLIALNGRLMAGLAGHVCTFDELFEAVLIRRTA